VNITIMPDGTARCLYSEIIDLRQLGRLHIERASEICSMTSCRSGSSTPLTGSRCFAHRGVRSV